MQSSDNEIWALLGRYFDRSMTPDDEVLLEAWLKQSPENRETLEFLEECRRMEADQSGEAYFSAYTDDDWDSVASRLNLNLERDLDLDLEQDANASEEERAGAKEAGVPPEAGMTDAEGVVSGDAGKDNHLKRTRFTDEPADRSAADIPSKHARSRTRQNRLQTGRSGRNRPGRLQTMLKIAALITIASLSAWLTLEFAYTPETEVVQQETELLRIVSTNRGERANVTLADGTTVMLNVDSRLLISPMTQDGQRRVTLEGEAFFDVAHDPSRPFLVESHGMVTEVLGTSFSIRSYESDRDITVVVKSGSVAVKRSKEMETVEDENSVLSDRRSRSLAEKGRSVRLQAGEIGLYNRQSDRFTTDSITNPDDLLGWTDNRLIFREASLDEIMLTLERWFDVTVIVELSEPGMKDRRFTLNMRKGHIRDAMELISESAGVEYELLDNDTVILR